MKSCSSNCNKEFDDKEPSVDLMPQNEVNVSAFKERKYLHDSSNTTDMYSLINERSKLLKQNGQLANSDQSYLQIYAEKNDSDSSANELLKPQFDLIETTGKLKTVTCNNLKGQNVYQTRGILRTPKDYSNKGAINESSLYPKSIYSLLNHDGDHLKCTTLSPTPNSDIQQSNQHNTNKTTCSNKKYEYLDSFNKKRFELETVL